METESVDKLRKMEDEAVQLTDGWSKAYQLTIYEILNRRHACTMDHIEDNRVTAWVREQREQKESQ